MTAVVLTKTCPLCGEEIEISGRMTPTDAGISFVSDDAGTSTAWDHQAVHDAADRFNAAVESSAAALGVAPEDLAHTLHMLRDARCWKRIPRCFNGWGVGLCARPNKHDGDCNPIPEIERKGRA